MTTQTDVEEMNQQGCFVSVRVSRPTLRTQLKWSDLGLPSLSDNQVSAPSTRPPSKEYNAFVRIESRLRGLLNKNAVGNAGGFRFMHYARFEQFNKDAQELKQDYLDAIEPFLAKYNEAKDEALAAWETQGRELWQRLKDPEITEDAFVERLLRKLRSSWPDASTLWTKFGVDIQVLQFTIPDQVGETLDAGLVAETRQKARNTIDTFFIEADNELRMRGVQLLRRLHEILMQGDTVSERSINPLREYVNQLRELSITPDKDFEDKLESCMALIEGRGGAQGMRESTETWAAVQKEVDEVASLGETLAEKAVERTMSLADRRISI